MCSLLPVFLFFFFLFALFLPRAVLDIPRLGCVNVHASLLPRWRGAAPIQHAILSGDNESGITLMQMNAGLDTGPVLAREAIPLTLDETATSLHDRLADLGGRVLVSSLPGILAQKITPCPQDEALACYAGKLDKAMARIDWTLSAEVIERQIRAFNPWPVSYTTTGTNENRLRVWQAEVRGGDGLPGRVSEIGADYMDVATGEGLLRLMEVQAPGGKRLPMRDYLNAHRHSVGECLGAPGPER